MVKTMEKEHFHKQVALYYTFSTLIRMGNLWLRFVLSLEKVTSPRQDVVAIVRSMPSPENVQRNALIADFFSHESPREQRHRRKSHSGQRPTSKS